MNLRSSKARHGRVRPQHQHIDTLARVSGRKQENKMTYRKLIATTVFGLACFALAPARADVSMDLTDGTGAGAVDVPTTSSDGSGASMPVDSGATTCDGGSNSQC